MFDIRIASKEDIPLIQKLTYQVWPQTYASILSQEQVNYMLGMMYSEVSLQKQMEEGARFLIINDNGSPAGFASWQEMKPGIFKLHKIYVLANQQGKGTGKFIINYIINDIKTKGAVVLQLQVNRYNKARDFYEKLGFLVTEEADFDIGNGYFMNDYVMEKRIN